MAEPGGLLPHLLVRDRVEDRAFRRSGGGDVKIRDVEQRAHGKARRGELTRSLQQLDAQRQALDPTLEELQATGVVVVVEGADPGFPLRIDSLARMSAHRREPRRPKWLVLSASPASEREPERVTVWISDEYREAFMKLFEAYVAGRSRGEHPPNRELVANIGRIRSAVLMDLWQSDGVPPAGEERWWELWLRPTSISLEALEAYARAQGLTLAGHRLALEDRVVVWVRGVWAKLEALPFTRVPVAEIRAPEFVDTVEDLPRAEQDELAQDLAARMEPAAGGAPAVCHLDTGVRRSHVLLEASLAEVDCHSIVGPHDDKQNHGTLMAGLALYGPLDEPLLSAQTLRLRHRLESVKMLPDDGGHDQLAYGLATAAAVAMPEASVARPRVFCMPVTAPPEKAGEPSLWSASIDALAAGVNVGRDERGIELLGLPDPVASRLFVISAGNVDRGDFQADYLTACDNAVIEDPAHAWNALTVGAYTELTGVPSEPSFHGWDALAEGGDISPHSRTSLLFEARYWPLKPDICMEGGNVLTDGASAYHEAHPLLCPRTSDGRDDLAIGSANATSAATAQAARLAALAQSRYPAYWPETIRGLLVHAAEWTPLMRSHVDRAASKTERLSLLRRYGWGVPDERDVLDSRRDAVTMVTQDEFVPFGGDDYVARRFRLHALPWPTEILRELAGADVRMRVTLSYFIEPTASRRGWRRRYTYPSHGLRFELKGPTETVDEFVGRVNREAQTEEDQQGGRAARAAPQWLIGPNQRNHGSLHQDIWEGSGAQLAESGVLAVHPVGGWWKYNARKDRVELPVRYSLLVSLRTAEQDIDLYTPIAVQLGIPIRTAVAAT